MVYWMGAHNGKHNINSVKFNEGITIIFLKVLNSWLKLSGAIRESTCQMPPNRQVDFCYRDRHEIIKIGKKKPADKNKYNRENVSGAMQSLSFFFWCEFCAFAKQQQQQTATTK